jgi:predicted amidophosphoribosyltransferase
MEINPIRLTGNWDEGFALDMHVKSSTHIGYDVYGNEQFETIRSDLGEKLYQFKYQNKYDSLHVIMESVKAFLSEWQAIRYVRSVVPVPPSTQYRSYQPAFEIAKEVANALGTHYFETVLQKTMSTKSKNLEGIEKQQISGSIVQTIMAKEKHSMLLIDDLFDSGITLTECVNVLRRDANIDKIYVLTVTKTKG